MKETNTRMKTHLAYNLVIILLLGVCGYIFYGSLDTGVTLSYRDQEVYQLERTRKQLMASLPILLESVDKAAIVAVMEKVADDQAWEKDGCTWVGWVGLKFAPGGRLQHVSPKWSMLEPDPCFPE